MRIDSSRRAFLAGLGATAAAGALTPRASANEASTEPAYRSATDLVRALAARQISARELLDAAIARVEALDSKFNAVVVRDFERARTAADAADAALGRGERLPLLGVPMTVKEQFHVAGLPTSWGYPRYQNWRPETDSLAVQRLKAAGALVIGKTNVPMGLTDWQSFNPVYGTTNNPWDPTRTPGGSSGGAAAALAAGFVPLELGSDIGGSLRAPAHFCGVFSHKPSLDLVPLRGSGYPEAPAIPTRGDMSVIGPMARSAADLALELSVLAGPDELSDGIGYKLALPAPRHQQLSEYRVLVLDKHPLCPTSAGIAAAIDGLADRLAKLGCVIQRANPKMPDLARTTRIYAELLLADLSADMAADDRVRAEAAAHLLSPEDQSLEAYRLRGVAVLHPEWVRSSHIRAGLRARWYELFEEIDVVLCPPMPTVAFPHDHTPQHSRRIDIDGKKIPYDDQIAWAGIATLTGLPATTAPIGRTDGGLPIGVQIVGGYLQDRTTIAFAGHIEHEFGGFTPPPGL